MSENLDRRLECFASPIQPVLKLLHCRAERTRSGRRLLAYCAIRVQVGCHFHIGEQRTHIEVDELTYRPHLDSECFGLIRYAAQPFGKRVGHAGAIDFRNELGHFDLATLRLQEQARPVFLLAKKRSN